MTRIYLNIKAAYWLRRAGGRFLWWWGIAAFLLCLVWEWLPLTVWAAVVIYEWIRKEFPMDTLARWLVDRAYRMCEDIDRRPSGT